MRLPSNGIRVPDICYVYKILDKSCNFNDFFLIFCTKILTNKISVLDKCFKTQFPKSDLFPLPRMKEERFLLIKPRYKQKFRILDRSLRLILKILMY